MKSIIRIIAPLAAMTCAGCATTTYEYTAKNPQTNETVTRKLSATSVFVKRDLGKVVLGPDSLDGSKSDQMQAASEALAIAAAALKR